MTNVQLHALFNELRELPVETEWVEFKEAKENVHFEELGEYFSALSNEANIKGKDWGWLVLGVTDKPPRQIVGTNYRRQPKDREQLKHEIAKGTNNGITFHGIHELAVSQKRVLMFQVPPAMRGIPTTWKRHFYGRDGESLVPLSMQEIELIRRQSSTEDWSAQICEGATLDDLDPMAVMAARDVFKEKNPRLAREVDGWNDGAFLNKAKLCISGRITRTAVILLGKPESEHFLSPSVAKISWIVKDAKGIEQDYQHFGPPFLLNVDGVFDKVRNLTYRYMQNKRLFPTEISRYDPWVMREALHNCIAHQDYTLCGGIVLVEEPGSLLVTNYGSFIPGSVEAVIKHDAPEARYRNRFLADAMVNLKMIDTIGSGIRRMFDEQRKRFFPLPDYDLGEQDRVKVRIFGEIIDENYTRMLMRRTGLDLFDVIALDKVQKRMPLTEVQFKSLKGQKLIEGRRPNVFVSAKVAAATESRADYIKHRAFDKEHYKKMVVAYLKKFGKAKREEIDKLLLDKVSDALTKTQKANWVKNLLQEMRMEGSVCKRGAERGPGAVWELSKRKQETSD
jgi:ATP-dependent DNA helicase RecG